MLKQIHTQLNYLIASCSNLINKKTHKLNFSIKKETNELINLLKSPDGVLQKMKHIHTITK